MMYLMMAQKAAIIMIEAVNRERFLTTKKS